MCVLIAACAANLFVDAGRWHGRQTRCHSVATRALLRFLKIRYAGRANRTIVDDQCRFRHWLVAPETCSRSDFTKRANSWPHIVLMNNRCLGADDAGCSFKEPLIASTTVFTFLMQFVSCPHQVATAVAVTAELCIDTHAHFLAASINALARRARHCDPPAASICRT